MRGGGAAVFGDGGGLGFVVAGDGRREGGLRRGSRWVF